MNSKFINWIIYSFYLSQIFFIIKLFLKNITISSPVPPQPPLLLSPSADLRHHLCLVLAAGRPPLATAPLPAVGMHHAATDVVARPYRVGRLLRGQLWARSVSRKWVWLSLDQIWSGDSPVQHAAARPSLRQPDMVVLPIRPHGHKCGRTVWSDRGQPCLAVLRPDLAEGRQDMAALGLR